MSDWINRVRESIRSHSSPTSDRSDAHGDRGQRGYIVWDNQIEFVAAALTNDWRLIDENTPNVEIIVATADGNVGEAHFVKDEWRWANNDPTDHWGDRIYPTHWQPLPTPPAPRERPEHGTKERGDGK